VESEAVLYCGWSSDTGRQVEVYHRADRHAPLPLPALASRTEVARAILEDVLGLRSVLRVDERLGYRFHCQVLAWIDSRRPWTVSRDEVLQWLDGQLEEMFAEPSPRERQTAGIRKLDASG
jgi:hypothetical protein